MKHIDMRVMGKVQGVFFRESTKQKAESLGIVGFVRNELDGNVYLEAEGEAEKIDEFIVWVKKGPTYAVVEDVKIEIGEVQHYSQFSVEY